MKIIKIISFIFIITIFGCGGMNYQKIYKGDKFIALTDFEITGLTHWSAPYTGGFKCVIPKGTILIVFHDPVPGAIGFGVIPENKGEFELKHVPESDRKAGNYSGYSFIFFEKDIGTKIRKIASTQD
jgi:hypothetical protein